MASNSALSEKSKESSNISERLPPVLLSHKVYTLISSVKEMQLITTYKEVLDGLGKYISKNNLYDPKNQKVCCKGDDLGSVLGTEEFSMSDLNTILPKLAVPISKISSCSAGSAAVLSENPLKRKLDGGFEYDQRKIPAIQSASPTIVHIPPSPTYCDLSDSIESIQGYETAYVKDTSDEFLSAENGEEKILAIEETFDIEYEVETDSSNSTLSEASSDSEELVDHIEEAIVKFLTHVVYKPKPDSDIEFFADASSDDDELSDAEISESDFWSCPKCNLKNKPTIRYCFKCFQERCNWLPDKPSNMKRKHRKSRVGFKGIKDKPSEASSSKCHENSQDNSSSSGVSCELKEPSNPSSLKNKSADSCKTDPGDSSSIASKDSVCMQSQDILDIIDVGSLDLINGESSGSLCMDSLNSSNIKSIISSNWDSSGPSSLDSGIYSIESSCPSSMECNESSHIEKYDSEKLCMICCSEPLNATIVHGKFSHYFCCYKCARRLKKGKKACPVCRRAIDKVTIQVTM